MRIFLLPNLVVKMTVNNEFQPHSENKKIETYILIYTVYYIIHKVINENFIKIYLNN